MPIIACDNACLNVNYINITKEIVQHDQTLINKITSITVNPLTLTVYLELCRKGSMYHLI